MARMRDKVTICPRCNGRATITVNMDTGKVTSATMPGNCKWPSSGRCAREHAKGVLDRPFGEQLIRPPDFGSF